MFRILFVDPGGTSGWATFTAERIEVEEGKYEYYNQKFQCGQLGPEDHHQKLNGLMEMMQTGEFVLGTESFEYRNTKHRDNLNLISCEYIGVIKRFAQERKLPVVLQTASLGKVGKKSFVRQGNLQRLGLWTSNFGHAMDGYGHLLYYMIMSAKLEPVRTELLNKGWR